MSIMLDDLDAKLAQRLHGERDQRGWSLADLADRSGVSKAMLSKIERAEASPTAVILARIASAFGQSLAQFLSFEDDDRKPLVHAADLPMWRDPKTGYVRRQIFIDPSSGFELVEILLPKGKSVAFPASVYFHCRHVVWVLSGQLTLKEGKEQRILGAGDRLVFGEPADVLYRNLTNEPCRYIVAVLRK